MNTFSLILEGKRSRDQHGNLRHRTEGQVSAIESLMKFAAERKDAVREAVTVGRQDLRDGRTDSFALTMDRDRSRHPLTIPVQKVERSNDEWIDGDTTIVSIDAYYPTTSSRLETEIPAYYLIPADEEDLLELLDLHHVEMTRLDEPEDFDVERYQLGEFRTEELANASYDIPEVEVDRTTVSAREGDVLVSTSQLHRLILATALEPQSKHGLLQYDEFARWRDLEYFPVMRVME